MTANKHTPGPWHMDPEEVTGGFRIVPKIGDRGLAVAIQRDAAPAIPGSGIDRATAEANARLIAAAPELLEALIRAQDFIDTIRQELHQRRVADWYPEGAHNAAEQMSEDMRLLGNTCADFDVSSAIAKATGAAA